MSPSSGRFAKKNEFHAYFLGHGKGEPRKIAIFRALYLGDLLLAVPALRLIRRSFPGAEITLIGLPWASEFVQRFACYVDRFVEFGGYPGIDEVDVDAERVASFLDEQRSYGYDLVVQMHGSGRVSNRFALALGGEVTVGYYEQDAGRNELGPSMSGLTMGMPYPENRPEVLRNLGLAEMLSCGAGPGRNTLAECDELGPHVGSGRNKLAGSGRNKLGPYGDARLEFPLFKEDRVEAAQLLREVPEARRPWIGLHVGAKPPVRRWPVEYFARVADYFAEHFSAQIILTGGTHEKTTVEAVAERMYAPALNVAGQTSLGGLAALISRLDLFISNDTGPAHIANAVDTSSVTIFGPVDPQRWASLDQTRHPIVRRPVACSPCGYWECPIDHRCLRWLSPEMVIEVAEKLLVRGAVPCDA